MELEVCLVVEEEWEGIGLVAPVSLEGFCCGINCFVSGASTAGIFPGIAQENEMFVNKWWCCCAEMLRSLAG